VIPPTALLLLAILRGSPIEQPPSADCQDVHRVELSGARATSQSGEVCVSSGLLTGFVFDAPVVVDLEDEVRFSEVTHGRTSISFMGPADGVVGEHFRLTARFDDGTRATFALVLHSGQATRQVEVYRDKRTPESFQHELAQERARNQQLQREFERLQYQLKQLRAECGDPRSMRRLIASETVDKAGIRALGLEPRQLTVDTSGHLEFNRGATYRTTNHLALEVWLKNTSEEPWSAVSATLVDSKGQEPGVRLWQQGGSLLPNQTGLVVVETEMLQGLRDEFTLTLREDGSRTISIQRLRFPQ
jgi:uncharacterized protein (TIGR02268 family)